MRLWEILYEVFDEVVEEEDWPVAASLILLAAVLGTLGVVGIVAFFPRLTACLMFLLFFGGFGWVLLYGPSAIIYRAIRLYFRHDNHSESDEEK